MENLENSSEITRARLELLYEVSRELATALDLRTVLNRVLFLSMKNVGAVSGSIVILGDSGQPVDSAFLIAGSKYQHTLPQLQVTFEQGLAGWVARTQTAVLVPDTAQDERWLRRPDDDEDRTGSKSAVSVPIMVREKLIGVMTLVHPKPGVFTDEHLSLVRAITDQAGIAILNARYYTESQRQARVMTAVADSAAVITASLDLKQVLQHILTQVGQAIQVERAMLALLDSQENELEILACSEPYQKRLVGVKLPVSQGIAGWVAQKGEGLIIPDVRKDERFEPVVDRLAGMVSGAVACAPIWHREKVIGILEVANPSGGVFDPDTLSVLNGIGGMAGIAIMNAQLFERLKTAHRRYRDLFGDSIDPILLTDWQGRILEVNRQAVQMADMDEATLHSMSIGDLHDVQTAKVGEEFQFLTSGETIFYEAVLRTPDNRQTPIQVYVRKVEIDGVPQLQWILRDITERKHLDNLRDDLISMIYHDLRSPLANIVSSLDVLANMLPLQDNSSLTSLMRIATRSTERIQRLTNSLLDIKRLEEGLPVVNRQPVQPDQLIKEAMDAVLQTSQTKNQSIEIDVSDETPPVSVDEDMMRRVLINLLENAIKFTPAEGRIQVGAQLDDNLVRFWVQDSGPGISSGDRERIFEKFARPVSLDAPRGLGLGLAFCRLAIEGHGGKIWVESAPERGAIFFVTLPKLEGEASDPTNYVHLE